MACAATSAQQAAITLVETARVRWKRTHRNLRDDVTVTVVFLPFLPHPQAESDVPSDALGSMTLSTTSTEQSSKKVPNNVTILNAGMPGMVEITEDSPESTKEMVRDLAAIPRDVAEISQAEQNMADG